MRNSDSKHPWIAVDKASIRHFRVGSMSNQRRSEGFCYLGSISFSYLWNTLHKRFLENIRLIRNRLSLKIAVYVFNEAYLACAWLIRKKQKGITVTAHASNVNRGNVGGRWNKINLISAQFTPKTLDLGYCIKPLWEISRKISHSDTIYVTQLRHLICLSHLSPDLPSPTTGEDGTIHSAARGGVKSTSPQGWSWSQNMIPIPKLQRPLRLSRFTRRIQILWNYLSLYKCQIIC